MRVSEKTSCLPDPLVPLDTKDRVRTKTSKAQRAGKTSSASSKASNGAIKGCSDNNHDPQNPSQVHNAISISCPPLRYICLMFKCTHWLTLSYNKQKQGTRSTFEGLSKNNNGPVRLVQKNPNIFQSFRGPPTGFQTILNFFLLKPRA